MSDLPLEGFGAGDNTRILSIEDGWVWLISLQKNVVNVGINIHQNCLKIIGKRANMSFIFRHKDRLLV